MAAERQALERNRLRWVFEVSLLAMLASGYLAVLGSGVLDLPSAIIAGAALTLRALQLAGLGRFTIPSRWITAATASYIVFYAIDYFLLSQDFIKATVHLVLFVAVAKILTAETRRDFFFLKVIAFLELLAASLLSANLTFFVFLVLFVLATVATFASSELLRPWEAPKVVTRGATAFARRFSFLTMFAALAILVLTAGLFFVLPRTARAALEKLAPANSRLSGIANEVSIGQMGEIRPKSTALLHVKFETAAPAHPLKFRGIALGEFDGWKWYNSYAPGRPLRPERGLFKLATDDQLRRPGKRLIYQVSARGILMDRLFLAGTPEYVQAPGQMLWEAPTGGYRLQWAEPEGLRYIAYTYLEDAQSPPLAETPKLGGAERNFYLRLPPVDPRVIKMAADVTRGFRTDLEKARALEHYLQTQLTYSLEPLERQVEDPLEYFLCERRKGHCEYFASALAVMLRLQWIPARVVTGFQGGNLNPVSGWHVIRASDAHSWVEAWIPGKGWVEFDPTPPDNSAAAAPGLWARFMMLADAAETFWQDWVVGYDLDRQVSLAIEVERTSRNVRWGGLERTWQRVRELAATARDWSPAHTVAGLIVLGAVVAVWLLAPAVLGRLRAVRRWRRVARGESTGSDAELLYRDLLQVLHKRGVEKPAWMTPLEFCGTLEQTALASPVREFTLGYYEFRFGGATGRAPQLAALLDRIRQTA